jgi:hypothetical protein
MTKRFLFLLLLLLPFLTMRVNALTHGVTIIEDSTVTTDDDVVCDYYQIDWSDSYWSEGTVGISGFNHYYRNITTDIGTPFKLTLPEGTGTLWGIQINFFMGWTASGSATRLGFSDGTETTFTTAGTVNLDFGGPVETDYLLFYPNQGLISGQLKWYMAVSSVRFTYCEKPPQLGCKNTFYWDDIGWSNGHPIVNGVIGVLSYGRFSAEAPGTIRLDFPSEVTFTTLEIAVTGDDDAGPTDFTSADGNWSYTIPNSPRNISGKTWWSSVQTFGGDGITTDYITMSQPLNVDANGKDRQVIWLRIDDCPAENLQRPFIEADEHEFGVWVAGDYDEDTTPAANFNFAATDQSNAPVYAILSGTVTEITILNDEYCSGYTGSLIDQSIGTVCGLDIPRSLETELFLVRYAIKEFMPYYRVRVETGDKTTTYLIGNPLAQVGDEITQSCQIGFSLPTLVSAGGGVIPDPSIYVHGFVGIGYEDSSLVDDDPTAETFEAVSLTTHPDPGQPCNIKGTVQHPLVEEDELYPPFDGFLSPADDPGIFCNLLLAAGLASCDIGELASHVLNDAHPAVKFSFSSQSITNVYAVAAGEVLQVEPIEVSDCNYYSAGLVASDLDYCVFEVPWYVTSTQITVFRAADTSHELFRVFVLTPDDVLITYIVTEPSVSVGGNIKVNCIIGKTIPLEFPPDLNSEIGRIAGIIFGDFLDKFDEIFGGNVSGDDINSVNILTFEDYLGEYATGNVPSTYEHHFQRFLVSLYPDPSLACNISVEYADCLTINPKFNNDGEFWDTTNPARPPIWMNPGVIIPSGGGIVLQALSLDTTIEYGASLTASTVSFPGTMRVYIGQSEFNLDIQPGGAKSYNIDPQVMVASMASLYDVTLLNTGDQDIEVDFFCITEGTPNVYPSNCYFHNPGFDLGSLFWTTSSGVTGTWQHIYNIPSGLPPWDLGKMKLTGGASSSSGRLSQPMTLYPNEDDSSHVYHGFIQYKILDSATWGSSSVAYYNDVDDISVMSLSLSPTETLKEFTLTVASGYDYDGTFQLEVTTTGGAHQIEITKICVEGPYPGQGGGGETPDPGTCDVAPAYPAGPTTETVLVWHWNNLDRFYNCTLMPMLQNMFKQMVKAYNFGVNQAQFWMYTTYKAINWLGTDFLPWLAGYMSNITPGTVVINNNTCSGLDLLCLISNLIDLISDVVTGFFANLPQLINQILKPILDFIFWVLGNAINLLFTVLIGVIVIALTILGKIISFLYMGVAVLVGLISAWNTAPAIPITGLPSCALDNTQSICTVWWSLENTIFAGPGSIIIPLIASFGWILLAIYVVRELKQMVTQAAITS